MALEISQVMISHMLAVQRLDLVAHNVAVLLDIVFLVKFVAKGDDVLACHVGI